MGRGKATMTNANRRAATASGGSGAIHPSMREADYAERWQAGWWRGRVMRTERGDQFTVIYEGRPGGAGPDFRDAVLARSDGVRLYGDIELHLRAGNWRAHGHDSDKRYAGVVLHIVFTPLRPLASAETPLPLGGAAPIAVLSRDCPLAAAASAAGPWPCAQLASHLAPARLNALLREAGHERFARREARYMREVAVAEAGAATADGALWTPRDRALFVAIAEALGYGRDRDALHAAGTALLVSSDPEAGSAAGPRDSIERSRLAGLLDLRSRWWAGGPWRALGERMASGSPRAAAAELTAELSVWSGRISPGRARIVAANVVLPFAGACGVLDGDAALETRARSVYAALPGPPSNAITRLMSRQLGLPRLPSGAASQQGLHHLWAEWCREKRCDTCPCAGSKVAPPVTSPPRPSRKPATLVGETGRRELAEHPSDRYNVSPSVS